MSEATRYRDFRHVSGTDYRTGSPLTWMIGSEDSGWELNIPARFLFQSSVPWYARFILSPHEPSWLLAAAVHDFLIEEGFDTAFAAGEWYRAARATNPRSWIVFPAYIFVILWTVPKWI